MLRRLYRFLHPRYQTLHLEYPVAMQPRYGHGKPPHKELYQIIDTHRAQYEMLLRKALGYLPQLTEIQDASKVTDPTLPGWNNGYLPGLDIVSIYTLLATYRPAQYIEIGSGNSTKVAHKAIREQGLPTRITSIDPAPRAEIDDLADRVVRAPFEDIDFNVIDSLGEGDVLFVDNSHRILPNSDAMVFFMEVLPRLKPGVIVHIHDVYLPYDYPQFMCDRFYSEQYGLAMYLLANPRRYQTLWPGYFIYEDEALSGILSPLWQHPNLKGVEQHGGSYWLRIVE